MADKRFWLGMLVIALVFGMTVVGCDNDPTGGDNAQKTLIVQNIPANVYAYGASGGDIGIFSAGTTPQQAMALTGIVAGANLTNPDIIVAGSGPYTLTIPLYNVNSTNRWTGSGTFDIYVVLNGDGKHYYKAGSVNITSETTTISFNNVTEVSPTGDGGGQIQSEYQGTYNVYGYHRHFDESNVIMPWASLTDPSFNSLKANYPTRCVLTSNSISMTGGGYTGQPFPANTSGSTLYVTMGGSEIAMGTFNTDGFRLTYGLDYASQGAYLLYKK